MTIITAVSDQHGSLNQCLSGGDILCILGDTVPLLSSAEDQKPRQEMDWYDTKYRRWLKREGAKYDHVILTGSNHDCLFEHQETAVAAYEMILEMGIIPTWTPRVSESGGLLGVDPVGRLEVGGLFFAAYNLSPTIHERPWPFSTARGSFRQQAEAQAVLDANAGLSVDVFLSHSPPAGVLDSEERDGDHYGCGQVSQLVFELMPKLSLHGHIHGARGKRIRLVAANGREIRFANCSIMDEWCRPGGGKPQNFEINNRT